jgi:hypothetical protein
MDISKELKLVKEAGIDLHKSIREGHSWFLPALSKELPSKMTVKENNKTQRYGTHYTEFGIQELAKSLQHE